MVCGMADVFQFLLQNGRIEVGFLGGAQIDRYGNINTTVVGDYDAPVGAAARERRRGGDRHPRPPHRRHQRGSAGGRFRSAVDFVTSPGHRMRGRHARASWACRAPGPVRVITDKAILEADPETGELVLAALYPGVTADEVRAGVGWPLRCRETLLRGRARRQPRSFGCCATCSIPNGST